MKKYKVKEYDTIRLIAEKNGLSPEQLIRANRNLSNLHDPYPGTELIIPESTLQDYNLQEGLMFKLETMDNTYYFFNPHAEPLVRPQDKLEKNVDEWSVKRIFQESIDSGLGMNKLYELYEPLNTGRYLYDTHPPDINKMVDKVVERTNGPHVITEYKFYYASVAADNAEAKKAEQSQNTMDALAKQRMIGQSLIPEKKAWVAFKVVADRTGEPIAHMKLEVTFPDKSVKKVRTNLHGMIMMKNVDPGSYDLSCNIERQSLKYYDTFGFIGMGESRIKQNENNTIYAKCEKNEYRDIKSKKSSWVVNIKEHTVSSGDSLKKIADQYGLTYKELLEFNWGTEKHEIIQNHVAYDTGCLIKDKESDDYIYNKESENEPDKIYAYEKWEKSGFGTNKQHVIRVGQAGYDIRIHYRYDKNPNRFSEDEFDEKADKLYLETSDKKWKYSAKVKDFGDFDEDWVEIVYPRPPEKTKLSMIQDPEDDGEDPFYVFHDYSLNELLETLNPDEV